MHLVMLETNGNQRYIFSSPRLRENIGASAQLVRLKEWTDGALKESVAEAACRQETDTPTARPVNGDDASDLDFITKHTEWVSRASGKVIFMVKTEDLAKAVIGRVTRTALAQAPGIDVSGVYIDIGDQSIITEDLLKKVHAEAAAYALRRSPAQARFSQMPFLARAKDSSLPAAPPLDHFLRKRLEDEAADDRATPHSLPSRIKRYDTYRFRKGLIELVTNRNESLKDDKNHDILVSDPTKLGKKYEDLRKRLKIAFSADGKGTDTAMSSHSNDASPSANDGDQSAQQEVEFDKYREQAEEVLNAIECSFQDGRSGKDNGDKPSISAQAPIKTPKTIILSKVAVIHIDGNSVGAIMRNLKAAVGCVPSDEFKKHLGCDPQESDALRSFVLTVSRRLDSVVADAFAAAWYDVAQWARKDRQAEQIDFTVVPIVPVILGGDDVTVITSGDYALPFAASFLGHFEKKTAAHPLLKYLHAVGKVAAEELKPKAVDPGPMTAAAGVAVVRRNFPFHIAYELAEKLVSRAKRVGKNLASPCSTLDFHVLFDTTVIDADDQLGGYKEFTQRPFRFPKPTTDAQTKPSTEAPAASVPEVPDAEEVPDPPVSATWKKTCDRVARFKGFSVNDGTRIDPFPRTRAARIRKLLSDGQPDEAKKHWSAAKEAVSIDPEIASGGPESLFDLLELADLLPDSYLQELTGMVRPESNGSTTSPKVGS